MLTVAKLHAESVAYYESTVDVSGGVDGYYSEDGRQPARAWVTGESAGAVDAISGQLGVEPGMVVDGAGVRSWFNGAVGPSGVKLGRAPGSRGVPGYDLAFCAPKSVSIVWGLTDDEDVRAAVDRAHAAAVASGMDYLTTHAGYTRRASRDDPSVMVIESLPGLSGVRYEHRTSRAGDPHVHSHVLLSNKQLCRDGKFRTIDGTSVYHELRAAGMVYQAHLRAELTAALGVRWGEIVNGCAEIVGLDDPEFIRGFSTRASEIDAWRQAQGVGDDEHRSEVMNRLFARLGQKTTRRRKDVDTPLAELQAQWAGSAVPVDVYPR
ncbi:Multifunctional conjugation protein TraI [Corynebacterium heidelbergense]|nr:Multifunctional conjugation protein TraI [Corynebacterium heidelbergense]